jgi:hypothetical protein
MLPAPGEAWWVAAAAAVVESERSVAGDVFDRNGHMDLDWRRRASIMDQLGAWAIDYERGFRKVVRARNWVRRREMYRGQLAEDTFIHMRRRN